MQCGNLETWMAMVGDNVYMPNSLTSDGNQSPHSIYLDLFSFPPINK